MAATSLLLFLIPALLLGAAVAQAQIVSPEVHGDRTVTFRFRNPGAKKVELNIEGSDPVPMIKGPGGLWIYTTAPLAPDLYGYGFTADGETYLDPHNPAIKPNLIWVSNVMLVPGEPPLPWEVQHVPHGTVHHQFYRSGVIGDERDYYVYTPPGYSPKNRTKYPVLYLLHGYSDTACGWTAVGQAHVILDNLIAAGKAKPMIVVMPLGYGVPDFASPLASGFNDPSRVKRNFDLFRESVLTELIPQVENEYSVQRDQRHRAIAGLSMGGAETLYTGLNNLDQFAYVCAFSSGGLRDDLATAFPNFDAQKANKRLKLLWVSCGTEDGLITFNRQVVKWLQDRKVRVKPVETPGRHTWMVWRRDLADVAELLFKD